MSGVQRLEEDRMAFPNSSSEGSDEGELKNGGNFSGGDKSRRGDSCVEDCVREPEKAVRGGKDRVCDLNRR